MCLYIDGFQSVGHHILAQNRTTGCCILSTIIFHWKWFVCVLARSHGYQPPPPSTRFWCKDLDCDLNNWRDSNLNIRCIIFSVALFISSGLYLHQCVIYSRKFRQIPFLSSVCVLRNWTILSLSCYSVVEILLQLCLSWQIFIFLLHHTSVFVGVGSLEQGKKW